MRAQIVLLQDCRILLARHERANSCYWVLPGGAVEVGESPEEAAKRELREESGLSVRLLHLLFVDGPRQHGAISIKRPRYTYLGEIIGGELIPPPAAGPANPGNGRLVQVEWMPLDAPEFDEGTRDTLALVQTALISGHASSGA